MSHSGMWTNRILVPFPPESYLLGVRKMINERERLWYHRIFEVPKSWANQHILLHFEASDWETKVWLNGVELGIHRGGYDRFSFDITQALKSEGPQELLVSVYDPSDSGFQPRGKQMLHPHAPFFSASSGIWQTVWLEPISDTSVDSLTLTPDIDNGIIRITVHGRGITNNIQVEAVALDGSNAIAQIKAALNTPIQLKIPNAKLWTPDTPFLYDLKISLLHRGKTVDTVCGYFGMRKISVATNSYEFPVMLLNNHPLFQLGPLDQGYWPDGIYTAPTEEAMKHDIEMMKQFGFNTCRKHVKVEPERWYYWCDKLGLLVWQDMPNGDHPATLQEKEIQRRPKSAKQFELELNRMIANRGNHPCIVVWIPFNQGWGQYETVRIENLIKEWDSSRLVIGASGWNDMGGGDIRSLHAYPGPAKPEQDGKRACVIGECGGLGKRIYGHMSGGYVLWNTTFFSTSEDLLKSYSGLLTNLQTMKEKRGAAGAIITQLTDVEKELNGFMTYDRAVIKMPVESIRDLSRQLIQQQVSSTNENNASQ